MINSFRDTTVEGIREAKFQVKKTQLRRRRQLDGHSVFQVN